MPCILVSIFSLQDLPKTSYFKFIDIWLLFCVFSLAVTMVIHTVVAHLLGDPEVRDEWKFVKAEKFASWARAASIMTYTVFIIGMMAGALDIVIGSEN